MLEVSDLHAWYGKSHVLQGVKLSVAPGEIVSLLGRNGAGRSTTLKSIMGEVAPKGSIQFKGVELAGKESFEIARLGLGYVPENREIFADLSVRENLLLGQKGKATNGYWTMAEVFGLFPQLAERADVPGGVLSGGEQQMLCIARTLIGNPELLMIDEPCEGLAPGLVAGIAQLLRDIASRGVGVLLVEQKLAFALQISRRCYIMGHGAIVWEGTPDELTACESIRAEWLGV